MTVTTLFKKLGFVAFFAGLFLWIADGDVFWAMAGVVALFVCLTVNDPRDDKEPR